MIKDLRIYVVIILLLMSVIDLSATYFYIYKYKKWQPNKPYNLMERNPLLVFLLNNFGLHLGMFIGSVIILTLIYIVGKSANPIVVFLLFVFLCIALYNHYNNISLLFKLIEKYPTGHLPESLFGKVVGNN